MASGLLDPKYRSHYIQGAISSQLSHIEFLLLIFWNLSRGLPFSMGYFEKLIENIGPIFSAVDFPIMLGLGRLILMQG